MSGERDPIIVDLSGHDDMDEAIADAAAIINAAYTEEEQG